MRLHAGSVYSYLRSGNTWSHQYKILAKDGVAGDQFGNDLEFHDVYGLIGAWSDDDKAVDAGRIYIDRYKHWHL